MICKLACDTQLMTLGRTYWFDPWRLLKLNEENVMKSNLILHLTYSCSSKASSKTFSAFLLQLWYEQNRAEKDSMLSISRAKVIWCYHLYILKVIRSCFKSLNFLPPSNSLPPFLHQVSCFNYSHFPPNWGVVTRGQINWKVSKLFR